MNIDNFTDHPLVFDNRKDYLAYCIDQRSHEGSILEFGVFHVASINQIARLLPSTEIYGFDSFEGLPEAWHRNPSSTYAVGHFAMNRMPVVEPNVMLIKGFFEETLPKWCQANKNKRISMIHIDSDLYSSASLILTTLNDFIVPGVVVAFDELCDWSGKNVYPFWPDGEWKALVEWVDSRGVDFEILARTNAFQAAIRIGRVAKSEGESNGLVRHDQQEPNTQLIEEMYRSPIIGHRGQHVTQSSKEVTISGHWLEFGVASGGTITLMAKVRSPDLVHGFDSFDGLPEDWHLSSTRVQRKGTFAQAQLPAVDGNVRLVVGRFEDTLPLWLANPDHQGPLAMVHIDCDLYSSTQCILSLCNDRIVPGTVIRFDDIAEWESYKKADGSGYSHWPEGEYRALLEWLEDHHREVEVLHRADRWGVTVRVVG